MATKHTPGPFSLEVRPDGNIDIGPLESGSVNPLATVYGDDNEPECWPVTANAKLLAAAPDLAEALLKMWENFDSHIHGGKSVHPTLATANDARAALRAAGRLP